MTARRFIVSGLFHCVLCVSAVLLQRSDYTVGTLGSISGFSPPTWYERSTHTSAPWRKKTFTTARAATGGSIVRQLRSAMPNERTGWSVRLLPSVAAPCFQSARAECSGSIVRRKSFPNWWMP